MSSCPTRYIGLPDIMEAFVQETTDDAAYAQARFSRAVSELQLMGFLKSTARRTDAAERSFFAPPGAAAFSTWCVLVVMPCYTSFEMIFFFVLGWRLKNRSCVFVMRSEIQVLLPNA